MHLSRQDLRMHCLTLSHLSLLGLILFSRDGEEDAVLHSILIFLLQIKKSTKVSHLQSLFSHAYTSYVDKIVSICVHGKCFTMANCNAKFMKVLAFVNGQITLNWQHRKRSFISVLKQFQMSFWFIL